MKILLCNNFVSGVSGIDQVVALEHRALLEAGHEVRLWRVENDGFRRLGPIKRVRIALSCLYSRQRRKQLEDLLDSFGPDVVHLHNTVPLMSGSIYDALKAYPSVLSLQSLHNYRALCPAAYRYRNGKLCTRCFPSFGSCARYGCYRHSRMASLFLVWQRLVDRMQGRPFGMQADHYLAVSEHVKKVHVRAGLPPELISVLPNPCRDLAERAPSLPAAREGVVYVGSLIEEKGAGHLPEIARRLPGIPLRVIGAGPLETMLREAAQTLPNLQVLGHLREEALAQAWQTAALTVIPSLWEEAFGLTAAESFSLGIPVVTTGRGGLCDIVQHGRNGWIVDTNDSIGFAEAIRKVYSDKPRLAQLAFRARADYDAAYTPARFSEHLMAILAGLQPRSST